MVPDARVADVMSSDVKYCYDDEDIERVLANMGEIQVRRLPVLNREKRLVGIVSLGDLAMTSARSKTAEALGDISRPGGSHNQTPVVVARRIILSKADVRPPHPRRNYRALRHLSLASFGHLWARGGRPKCHNPPRTQYRR